jgi:cytochrome c55X
MNGRRTIALAWVLAAASAVASAQGTDQIDAGRKLYISACQRCHGINLSANGIGFDLRTFLPHDKERFVRSVTNGIRAMPAWGNTLKPEQMDQIWAYIGSVNGWKATPGPQ